MLQAYLFYRYIEEGENEIKNDLSFNLLLLLKIFVDHCFMNRLVLCDYDI